MPRGFDTSTDCTAIAPGIKSAGYDFVCRYYSHNLRKCLTLAEGKALSAAGVSIVTIWEDLPLSDSYFSRSSGAKDGASAYHMASQLGQPLSSAIYFAVDYDIDPARVAGGPLADYFAGVGDGFAAAAGGAGVYAIGIYGSGAACDGIVSAGLAQYAWLAQSTAWHGTAGYTGWNICQGMGATLLGIGVDTDAATSSCGAFTL
jgi:hypothetical protein